MSRAVQVEAAAPAVTSSATDSRGLAVGLIAMVPLLAAYEVALHCEPGARRNVGELALGLAFRPLGVHADMARWCALAFAVLAAWVISLRRGTRVAARCARIGIEGALAAAVLGPLLVLSVRALRGDAAPLDVSWDPTAHPPDLVRAALVFGGAAWEELCFRVGVYSFAYWLALRAATAAGARERLARGGAELAGLAFSAAAFVLAHFAPLGRGSSGARAFDPALATWLGLAGVVLGLLFRWRGAGVAAWAHGLFNLGLYIGVDPDVVL